MDANYQNIKPFYCNDIYMLIQMDMVSIVITRLNDICQELFIPKGMYFLYYSCGIEKISNIPNDPSFIINLIELAKKSLFTVSISKGYDAY